MNFANKRARKYHRKNRADREDNFGGTVPEACGKICYPSASLAKSAVRRLAGRGQKKAPGPLNHYWCRKCQSWHVGHSRIPGEARP